MILAGDNLPDDADGSTEVAKAAIEELNRYDAGENTEHRTEIDTFEIPAYIATIAMTSRHPIEHECLLAWANAALRAHRGQRNLPGPCKPCLSRPPVHALGVFEIIWHLRSNSRRRDVSGGPDRLNR